MVRCFVAIECNNPEVLKGIKQVQEALASTGANLKPVETENIHLTLKFLGEIPQHKVDEVTDLIKDISFEAFNFKVEEVGVFPNHRRPATIWAGISEGVTEVTKVFEELDAKLSKLGFERERRKFHPHFTIGRVRSGKNKDQLVEELMRLETEEFGLISADRVVFKKSFLTPSGPVYTTFAESRHS